MPRDRRELDKAQLWSALQTARPAGSADDSGDLFRSVMAFLAATPSALWLVNQEDLTGETAQQNLPGTTGEYPNWTRKMRCTLEELQTLPEIRERAAFIRHLSAARAANHPG